MKQVFIRTCIVTLLFAFTTAGVFAYSFNRNLTIGSTGQDVLELQRVLNSNEQTKLAETGPGSPGNETSYFGSVTKNAVIKYQNLFRQAILAPVGLTFGTGYFGPSTRAQLNVSENVSVTKAPQETISISSSPNTGSTIVSNSFMSDLANSKDLYLFYLSSNEGPAGTTLTLHGTGFEKENTVFFDGIRIQKLSSDNDGTSIVFKVPAFEAGYYRITVENSKGKTDTDAFFIIKDKEVKAPTITSVSPEKGYYAETVTIKGTGFTKENNQIRTSYEVISGIPSEDGTTLEFGVRPFPDTAGIREGVDMGQDVSWPISINIINDNGISNRSVFTLEF